MTDHPLEVDNLSSEEAKRLKLHDLIEEETFFDHLPDEVQLKIFKFLEIEDLIRCAQVSKRTRRICHDESIWKKVNLNKKLVPSEFIEKILENGCKYISLTYTKIIGDLKLSEQTYSVKYLNLSNCLAEKGVLEKFICSCKSLQKLSLTNLMLSSDAMKNLNHQKLQTLDLTTFTGLDLESMTNILCCKTLTEISFRYSPSLYNSKELVQYLVENLSSDIEKVSLGGLKCLTDEHVKTLVQRCKKIKELELSGSRNITENSLTSIVEHSDEIVKLDVSTTNVWAFLLPVQGNNLFLKLNSMPKLKVLNCQHPKRPSQETENLRKLMPRLNINQDQFGGDLDIANPNESIKPEDGLWDILVKGVREVFPDWSPISQNSKPRRQGRREFLNSQHW